ncbi:MAG: Gamma-glutamyl phosphate reductase [Candidatus Ordinivivax streblomastigis]|uniref:Gamma-glutamyl phosphate reductase n=1 Tax=Candidatus Ordinivivax streblomastigis TaxID=2540710 RepID=A0A5M8P441_9BACT|nr:MAG: Gamma-glutamyl phosphate reductase [Candidatus Ordinivivax streblomastigis]KAA6303414.1 MAG: Gamma-glutamyl phosphate reductase [Candidatus Ordinivivax streblomastigis]
MELSALFNAASQAGRDLNLLSDAQMQEALNAIADAVVAQTSSILSENQKDLERMDPADPKYDRLVLTQERIADIAADVRKVAQLPSPLGRTLLETTRPNGLKINKVSVPFGVIGVIYEARPNVSLDVFSLCFKSGNVCLLKGGSDAEYSNRVITGIIRDVLQKYWINPDCCILLPVDREATSALLNAVGYVDLLIPRGSKGLIEYVREHAKVPVIETGAGVCHTYLDVDGNPELARNIVNNAKTRRVSVCNALDCLIIHRERLADLPYICGLLSDSNVIIYADEPSYQALAGKYPASLLQPATPASYGIEFLDYKMSIQTVNTLYEALQHIHQYSSKHSECILTDNPDHIALFEKRVDAACVYSNASTAFSDGAQFGLGAEIGISTQKLHARGPMGLQELTSYKWIIQGEGQTRT